MGKSTNNIETVNNQKDLIVEDLLKNNLGLQVLTDSGWSDFDALHIKGIERTVTIKTDKSTIVCTPTHKFYTNKLDKIEATTLKPRTKLYGRSGIHSVVSIAVNEDREVYDLINVAKNNRFYANDVLVSNCEFIIFDETLINPLHLVEMSGIEPIERQGQIRWYKKPEKGRTYVVGLDPSLGTGGDPAGIQVFELPGLKQVAEWSHNKTIVQRQVVIMQEICRYLVEIAGNTNVYYSVENNTLGEAALVVISQMGEENIPGVFLSEPRRQGGGGTRFRKGFNTSHKSKLAACAKLKSLIETKRMKIASKLLISEFKNFIAKGNSYEAKIGEHDDLIMAVLLCIRMMQLLQEFDANMDAELRDNADNFMEPMPFIMVGNY
jgi:hypothetical protein